LGLRNAHDYARVLLALIRLFNGGVALVAPQMLAGRLGVDAQANPGILYVFRMFGIRTVLIAADLLVRGEQRREEAVRDAPLIHASDTVAAALAWRSGRLPAGAGATITTISAINTALALYARAGLD
jgi:hypothetical protein